MKVSSGREVVVSSRVQGVAASMRYKQQRESILRFFENSSVLSLLLVFLHRDNNAHYIPSVGAESPNHRYKHGNMYIVVNKKEIFI